MTQLVILTNDDWWGVFTLGLKVNKPFTFLFIITMVYILNFMTFGFVFAVLLDGFSKLDTRDENENESSKK